MQAITITVTDVAEGGTLLTDDFADGNFNGWTIIDEGTIEAPSAWAVVSEVLEQSSNIYDGNSSVGALSKLGTFAWYTAGLGWSNYQFTAQIQSTDNDALGVMVRYQDPDNYYRFSWDKPNGRYRRLVKVVNGTFTLLATETVPYVGGQAYQLDVIADGTTIDVRVDGAPLFGGPVTDSALPTGSVGLYSWGNDGSRFDGVVVTAVGGGNTAPIDYQRRDGECGLRTRPARLMCKPRDDHEAEGAGLTYSKTGGADQALLTLEATTGMLTSAHGAGL